MFSFFKRKKSSDAPDQVTAPEAKDDVGQADTPEVGQTSQKADVVRDESASAEGDAVSVSGAIEAADAPTPDTAADASSPSSSSQPTAYATSKSPDARPEPLGEHPAPETRAEAPEARIETLEAQRAALQPADALSPAAAPAAPAAPAKVSWMARLKQGLSKTGQSLGGLFVGVKVDENLFEELETALIMADAGVEATNNLLTALRTKVRKDRLTDAEQVKTALRDILAEHLRPLEKNFPIDAAKPLIVMIAGVNGAGKTTSIGKLANTFQRQGKSVLLAAGDTFRAAAREQLIAWGARNNVTVISQEGGDPAAVAFDAVNAGRARGADVVMVDTAGRLPTQLHLMEELKKIRRVIGKADGNAPHEVLLVVDGNTGQNAIAQIRAFDAAINLTGLVVTKLDGTAKGGTLAAVAAGSQGVRPVPVYWIGVGEGIEDLQPFVAAEFAAALLD